MTHPASATCSTSGSQAFTRSHLTRWLKIQIAKSGLDDSDFRGLGYGLEIEFLLDTLGPALLGNYLLGLLDQAPHFVGWKPRPRRVLPCASNPCCTVVSRSVMCNSLWPRGLQPTRLLCPWGFPRQVYWSGLPCPPPGDLPNPEIEPRPPALQEDSLTSEPPGKPKNTGMGREAYPFSRGSSWPRNWTGVSCIAGRFFTSWATR